LIPPSRLAVRFIETYRERVRHRLPSRCRFQPTCSEYGIEAYSTYGFVKATRKTLWRIVRCNRWNHGPAVDPP
jgi:putative membrane protein insertion efficiency factor